MIRVCPHSDAKCVHGMNCAYTCATDAYDGNKNLMAEQNVTRAPAPEGEAVAWRWRNKPDGVWNYQEARQRIPGVEQQPLYASPVVPVGVSREEIARTLYEATPARVIHPLPIRSLSWDEIKTDDPARADRAYREADAIIAALRPTDTRRRP